MAEVKKWCEKLYGEARCDEPGGTETYRNQVAMAVNGKACGIDPCIHRIVAALNAGGIRTMASCCGHNNLHGRIDLEDGRVLVIVKDDAQVVWQVREQKKHPFTCP